ncbi:MAG TPA: extracellular solute-binding protein [Actinomycetes bacterium]|nr:extracellular solute-binding protein [Actinomycetes bacterium]
MRTARTLALGAAALALVAAGCSSSGDDEDASAPGGTITVWTHINKSFNKEYEALAQSYMDENEDVTIKFETFDYDSYIQTLQTAFPAGNEADVLQMFGSWVCSYSSNLSTVPDDVMSMSDAEEDFFAGPLGGYKCDDKLYGLPQESNVEYGATLVNTQMAEAANVSTDGWESYDEFMADAKAMTVTEDGEITRAGYHFTTNDGIAYAFLSLILQNGGSYLAEDGTFTFQTPEAAASMDLMNSFVTEGIVDPGLYTDTTNWVGDCYFGELCAMGLVGPWVVPEYEADFPEVAAVTEYVALPTLENGNFAADSGWGLTVSSNSPEQELAWDFIDYVAANASNALQWNLSTGTLPALKENAQGEARDELSASAAYLGPWLDILDQAQYLGSLPDRDRLFYKIIVPNVLDVMNGQKSTEDALAAIEQEANSL